MNLTTFEELERTILKGEGRIREISIALQEYAIVDANMTFIVDPIHRTTVLPFLEKVKKHRAAHVALRSGMDRAHELYFEHFKRRVAEPIQAMENELSTLQNSITVKQQELKNLMRLDSNMQPAVPEDKAENAAELRRDILTDLPEKIEKLEAVLALARKPFLNIALPPIPMKGFGLPGEVEQA